MRVRYASEFYNPSSSYLTFRYPIKADLSRPVYAYLNGELVATKYYTYDSYGVTVKKDIKSGEDTVEIVFFASETISDFGDIFSDCTIAEAFGGNLNGGTRLFMTGHPLYKGVYYRSALQDPLYFPENELEVIGDGCEDITAMKRMYGDLIIFTKNSVYRMSYNPSYEITPFVVKEIGNGVGCDCPKSVCLIDNRVVFLNSEKGVFIVDSTESTGEQNIKPISGNILFGCGEGLLNCGKDDLIGCSAIDFDRKYILSVGKRMYIWDYDRSPFRSSSNYALSQENLVWYIYSLEKKCEMMYQKNRILLCIDKENYTLSTFDEVSREGVKSGFSTGRLSLASVGRKKQVLKMNMLVEAFTDGKMKLDFYADGVLYCSGEIDVKQGETTLMSINLPSKTLISFALDAEFSAGVRIEDVSFDYKNT